MRSSSNFAALLMLNPLFDALGAEAVDKIAALGTKRTLKPDEVLFLKGGQADALYAIRRGEIRIESGTAEGERMSFNLLGVGDVFGEIGLLDGKGRSADARAVKTVELFQLQRRDFFDLLEREPTLAIKIIELLCERVRTLSNRIEETMLLPLPARIARRLAALATDFGAEIEATQEDVAVHVGAARETVSRQLQQWRVDGTLALGRGKIKILDARKLRRHAQVSV